MVCVDILCVKNILDISRYLAEEGVGRSLFEGYYDWKNERCKVRVSAYFYFFGLGERIVTVRKKLIK